jgi:hypothetical protein
MRKHVPCFIGPLLIAGASLVAQTPYGRILGRMTDGSSAVNEKEQQCNHDGNS